MRVIRFLLLLAFVLVFIFLALAFITHNQTLVSVNLLFVPVFEAQLAIWLIGFFIAGSACGLLASMLVIIKEKTVRRRMERRMQQTSKMISGYHA